MGRIWASLWALGLLVPGLLLAASTLVVLWLAKRLRRLSAQAKPPWWYVAIHLGLGLALSIPLGPIAALAWLLVPGHLYRALRRVGGPTALGAIGHPLTSPRSRKRRWGLAALFTMTGVLLPWATGLGVRAYLDARGRPTLPVGGFLDPASLVIELLLTLGAWAFPFVLLASAVAWPWRIGFAADSPERDSLLPIWLAYLAGVVTTIPVFVAIFWEFDSIMLLTPVGLLLLPPMALGYLAGWWLVRRRAASQATGPGPERRGSLA